MLVIKNIVGHDIFFSTVLNCDSGARPALAYSSIKIEINKEPYGKIIFNKVKVVKLTVHLLTFSVIQDLLWLLHVGKGQEHQNKS